MQEFKSKIKNSLSVFLFLTLPLLGFTYFVLFLTIEFNLSGITIQAWLVILLTYGIICYIYAGLSNNDVLVFEDRIEIINRLPLFRRNISFQLKDIELVKFRHEWTETFGRNIKPNFMRYIITQWIAPFLFPIDYKWIKVTTDKDYKFYCFGLEMDYYENEGPLFEDLFYKLADKGVNVGWTDTSDNYYAQMTNKIKK